ncbi:MAG: LptA/OstA family protein [Proteobacteria bacterium]|nr:LptA/OstA family protein [Pseudomonadota bacterium]
MAIKHLLILIFCLLLTNNSFSQDKNIVDINANLMELMEDKKMIIFTGDVVAKKADMTLYCSKLEVFYKEDEKTKKKDIDYMIAKGDVKVVQKDRVAKGDIGKYLHREDIVILEGNPVTVTERGENQITANKITFYMKENKSVVEGNRPRVIFKLGE